MSLIKLASAVNDSNIRQRLNSKYLTPALNKYKEAVKLHMDETENMYNVIKNKKNAHHERLLDTFRNIKKTDEIKAQMLHPKLMRLGDKLVKKYSKKFQEFHASRSESFKKLDAINENATKHVDNVFNRYKRHENFIKNRNIKRGSIGAGIIAAIGGTAYLNRKDKK